MKILHLLYESRGDSFGIGGVGVRAYEIYSILKERHDITLLCKKYPGAHDAEIGALEHVFVGTESPSLARTLLSFGWEARRFVKERGRDYDVIVEEFSPAVTTFLDRYEERPVVLQIQGYTGKQYFDKYAIYYSAPLYLIERSRPLRYKNVIVVSDATRRKYNLADSQNIAVISNGISASLLSEVPAPSDYILYLGRIDIHHKGLDILIDAYSVFHKAFPDIRLVIAGDGRDRERFAALLRTLPDDVQRSIELTGWANGEEKTRLLRNALLVAVPSRYETQGIVVLEAMACGKAVVVSDIPELRYVTESGAGTSFKAEDAASLAACLKRCAESTDLGAFGQKGREWVKDYTWDAVAHRYEEFLKSVRETHGRNR